MRIIKASEVVTLPRGRKATFNADLVKTLKGLKAGSFGVLDEEFPAAVDKDTRAKVSGIVRKHWSAAHPGVKCAIRWTPEGFAQVGEAKA